MLNVFSAKLASLQFVKKKFFPILTLLKSNNTQPALQNIED